MRDSVGEPRESEDGSATRTPSRPATAHIRPGPAVPFMSSHAAEHLGITQARVSEIKHGKIDRFSLSMLVRLAQRTGLRPCIQRQGQIRAWLETAPFLLAAGIC